MDDKQLVTFNQKGLIPGPEETEESFLQRVDYCLKLNESIGKDLGEEFPFKQDSPPHCLEEALHLTQKIYGIYPEWIPVFFSNYQLNPWHGGCAWIFKRTTSCPTGAFLQLRKSFYHSRRFLGIYSREELAAHELVHVGRMMFNEPKFEEFLAYRTSPSSFRRWLGPIAQSSRETLLFAGMLLLILLVDLGLVLFGEIETYQYMMWLKAFPAIFLSLGFVRLFIRHRQAKRCVSILRKILPNPQIVDPVLYRLTDEEILALGRMDEKRAQKYVSEREGNSLRWKAIKTLYSQ